MTAEVIGIIMLSFTLLLHLIGMLWWAATLTKRVDYIEKWVASNEYTSERLATLESQAKAIQVSLERIESYIITPNEKH